MKCQHRLTLRTRNESNTTMRKVHDEYRCQLCGAQVLVGVIRGFEEQPTHADPYFHYLQTQQALANPSVVLPPKGSNQQKPPPC